MRFRIFFVLPDDTFVHCQRLVEFTDSAEVISSVKGSSPLLVVYLGQCHSSTAVFAGAETAVRGNFHIPTAHFAFNNCHVFLSFVFILPAGVY